MPLIPLITADGRVNRGAVLLDARRQFRVMGRLGWDWSQCLEYSWSRARAMQYQRNADRMADNLSRLPGAGASTGSSTE